MDSAFYVCYICVYLFFTFCWHLINVQCECNACENKFPTMANITNRQSIIIVKIIKPLIIVVIIIIIKLSSEYHEALS